MGLLDDVAAETKRRGGTCGVWLATHSPALDEAAQADLAALVADHEVSAGAIERALRKKWATELPESIIQRHRRGSCRCADRAATERQAVG